MHLARSVRISVAAVACTALLSLAACSGDDAEPEAKAVDSSETPTADPTEDTTEEAEETPAPEAAAGQPDWALPVTTGGDLVSTVEVGDVTVEVYQVGTTKASEDGNFADPDTNKPLLAKGDPIVFLNYVVTNNGEPIDLGSSLVSISARYDDWQWLQGMDSVTDDALFEQQGVNDDAFTPDAYREPSVYPFGTGASYSYAENFKHQKGSPITFDVSITPVDAEGELLHDDRVEATGTGTVA